MKASDYIVEYLINKRITDVFGYPGGMVTHLMDSFSKYTDRIQAHVAYNEQGAAMAACGYAQASGLTGVAYATSGPGATNMITGICNAYMDSIPTVFITGQVNSFEQKGDYKVRQRGFQETDIVMMVKPVTKFAVKINSVDKLKYYLDYAFYVAHEGRKGPVLLDIAMDVMRDEINPDEFTGFAEEKDSINLTQEDLIHIIEILKKAKKPVILLGKGCHNVRTLAALLNESRIPVVSSMIAIDIKANLEHYYGFIGAYGDRVANFIVAKSDLVLAVGARLDVRQVGAKRENFAPDSKLIRIDIDKNELEYKVHEDEIAVQADGHEALKQILRFEGNLASEDWIDTCEQIRTELQGYDDLKPNHFVSAVSDIVPDEAVITTDVGQNQVWVAQSFKIKDSQQVLFSGGHGAMGYSLPAAIGAYYATKKSVYSFNGDGGLQMNIQELQWVSRDNLPIKIIVFNNNALGMIRHFQEMYFKCNYYQTTPQGGFDAPNFEDLAKAYRLGYGRVDSVNDVEMVKKAMRDEKPAIIEVKIPENTYVFPKLEFGKPNQDQEPLLDRSLYYKLMEL